MDEWERKFTEDSLLGGRVRLVQPRRGHRAGTDAVLLAACVDPKPEETVYDFGAGVGAVGLMIGVRTGASIAFVEKEDMLIGICAANIRHNGLTGRARVIETDILARPAVRWAAGLKRESADVVVTNPPFLEESRARRSPSALRAAAHHLPDGGFERWMTAAADVLKPGGRLALIHRADRLEACLSRLARGFGEVTVRPVYPRAGEAAIRILVTAMKGSRAPIRLLPGLTLHEAGGFTEEAAAVHAGERLLLPTERGARRRPHLRCL
jgi:tRNA1(Val) A37 N6-methylase TrmN6